jgi:Protein of unknown function (DUF3522)
LRPWYFTPVKGTFKRANARFQVRAIYYGRYTRGAIYAAIPFTSGSYHACDAYASACLFGFGFHHQLDFFFAELIIPLSALYLIHWGDWAPVERFLIVAFGLALAILQYLLPTSDFVVQGAVVATALAIVTTYWIGYAAVACMQEKRCVAAFPAYNWPQLLAFVALATLSIVMFSVQNYVFLWYDWIHSLWHCLAAFGQFFLLDAKPPTTNRSSPLDAKIQKRL